jgi:hypothetical protein
LVLGDRGPVTPGDGGDPGRWAAERSWRLGKWLEIADF